MNDEQFKTLNKKLDVLIGLLTMNFTKGQTLKEQVELLNSLGLSSPQIATVLGKPLGSVSKTLDRIKKEGKKNDK